MFQTVIIHSKTEAVSRLKREIPELSPDFTVVASFIYSKHSLEQAVHMRPDLVIVDFPAESETARGVLLELRRRLPEAKLLVYTENCTFSAAKLALSQGVSAYITPGKGERAELRTALFALKEELEQTKDRKQQEQLLSRLLVTARKQFLTDIFMGNITGGENIRRQAQELSLGSNTCIYCPFWIAIPDYNAYITNRWEYAKERFFIALGNFLHPENEEFEVQNIMYANGEILYVAISESTDATTFINRLRLHLSNAEHNLKALMDLSISWHIGRHFMSFHDFAEHISRPIFSEPLKSRGKNDSTPHHAYLLDMYQNVVISAMLDKTPRLKEHLSYIVRLLIASAEGSPTEVMTEFCGIVVSNMAPELRQNADFQKNLQALSHAAGGTAQNICTNILFMICREVAKTKTDTQTGTLRRALTYMENNFSHDLSLEDISGYMNLNPSYFSRFFKQKTGQNYRDYLIRLRTEKAKELLLSGKYKIYEISMMTGYKNSKYFAAQFKSVTGMTPREFAEHAK